MDNLTLEWQTEGQAQRYIATATATTRIGRQGSCDIVLSSGTVSREHALIFRDGPLFYIRNVSGRNPIHMNDGSSLGKDQQAPLKPGNVFRVGPVEFIVVAGPSARSRKLKAVCPKCHRTLDYNPAGFCPWDGTSLSGIDTIFE